MIDDVLWQAIVRLLQRKWWSQAWILQEALLSLRTVIQCGKKQADVARFVQLVALKHVQPNLARDTDVQNNPAARIPPSLPLSGLLHNWDAKKRYVESCGSGLSELIFIMHGSEASLRRDKIFALLSITTYEAKSWIFPEYSSTISDRLILIRLTIHLLQKSFTPLLCASFRRFVEGAS